MCTLPKNMNIEFSTQMIAEQLPTSPEIAKLIASVSQQFTDAMQNTNPTEYLIIDLTSVAPPAQWYVVDKLAERFGKVYYNDGYYGGELTVKTDYESKALFQYLLPAPGKLIPKSEMKGWACGWYRISHPKLLQEDKVNNKDIRKNTRLSSILIPLTPAFNPQQYFWARNVTY